jgi:acetyltransferase-like isoleucine patch superfamily enzyme
VIIKLYKLIGRIKNKLLTFLICRNLGYAGKKIFINFPFYFIDLKSISIGNGFFCGTNCRIEAYKIYENGTFSPKIHIGENVKMNYNCHIGCINEIIIEDNVLIGSNVFISDHFHGTTESRFSDVPPFRKPLISKGRVIIEKNVWIGENVSIMPGITIGKNSIIGANAVVTKSFPEYSVIVGNPAKNISKEL